MNRLPGTPAAAGLSPSAAAGLSTVRRARRREKLTSLVTNEIILDALAELLRDNFAGGGGEVLDLGAGAAPYAPLYREYFRSSVAVDVATSPHDITGIDVVASADDLPFESSRFDCVICTEVLEHCARPGRVLGEVARVLKPGGIAFVTTPFMVGLHEMPRDYYRYTPSALRHLAASSGLTVDSIEPRGDYLATLIAVLLFPLVKAWRGLSRLTGIELMRPANPLVALTVALPQRVYLSCWRRGRRRPESLIGTALSKFEHWTPGYVTVMRRPVEGVDPTRDATD